MAVRRFTMDQVEEAVAQTATYAEAARLLGCHPSYLPAYLRRHRNKDKTFSVADIPPQFMPLYETVKAKMGATDALRIIKDHIEKRG